MGVGDVLENYLPNTKLVAVEPAESPVMSGGEPGLHGIQGIGDGSKFMVDLSRVSRVITISTDEAKEMVSKLSKDFGLFIGISGAANVLGSLKYAQETNSKNIVTILCDRGERYLSCL